MFRSVHQLPTKSSAQKHRRIARSTKTDISSDNAVDIKPKRVAHFTRVRVPAAARRRFLDRRYSLPVSHLLGNSTVGKDGKVGSVPNEDSGLPVITSTDERASCCIIDGDHAYYSKAAGDVDRWAANGMVFGKRHRLNLIKHSLVEPAYHHDNGTTMSRAGGAAVPCDTDFFSRVQTDHNYAKRAPLPEELFPAKQRLDESQALARLTVLDSKFSPSISSCLLYTSPSPRD